MEEEQTDDRAVIKMNRGANRCRADGTASRSQPANGPTDTSTSKTLFKLKSVLPRVHLRTGCSSHVATACADALMGDG